MYKINNLLLACLCISGMNGCAVYDLDDTDDKTLSGALSRILHKKDLGRQVSEDDSEKAPIYVDYSKNNPVLLHDDEYEEEIEYEEEDPFEEAVEFSDFKKLKKRQQEKRDFEKDHKITKRTDKEDDGADEPVSLW